MIITMIQMISSDLSWKIKTSLSEGRIVLCMFLLLALSGCKVVPPAQADTNVQPVTLAPDVSDADAGTPDIEVPEAVYRHELRFDVRAGLRARVIMSETQIVVQVNNQPPVNLHRVNFPLLREWGTRYLKVNDYDRDGLLDLAVMTSAGRGGDNKCYAIYRYNPQTGQFRQRKSFDRCNI